MKLTIEEKQKRLEKLKEEKRILEKEINVLNLDIELSEKQKAYDEIMMLGEKYDLFANKEIRKYGIDGPYVVVVEIKMLNPNKVQC